MSHESYVDRRPFFGGVGRAKDFPGLRADVVQRLIGSARMVMKEPQPADAIGGGEFRALAPVAVPPAAMVWQLVGREMRVEDDRGGAVGKRGERPVECRVPELVVRGVHEVAAGAFDPVRERTA